MAVPSGMAVPSWSCRLTGQEPSSLVSKQSPYVPRYLLTKRVPSKPMENVKEFI